eukprot:TRINITY_DN2245_c0_g1::TRINITY_DN2245_c0_g1_i1::g.6923::m.6923 TRINITY_DN2245_c0_g1::TRINITY_DN2245_c0_g1_i1::g.6923  ORF type:complete len:211 (+),score=95.45,sp/P62083/RS7_RAT/63.35/2e-81,Ribosomal_S7e/PF01251.13/3.2e-86,AAA_24/PF13479.1/0.094 TRINITY_DN2245_c0_g1_i1:53-634(+)
MLTARKKIQKENGAQPDEFEEQVAQALFDLEVSGNDINHDLKDLVISAAKEFDVAGGKKAVAIFVPFPSLQKYHKIQQRLVRELEKKFSGKHVVIIGQRRILPKENKKRRLQKQHRPRSRTLTAVHNAVLDDLVYPTEIVGKRLRYRLDGSRVLKVYLDPKDQANVEHKVDTFANVYKRLTGKDVTFEFPVQE